MPRHSRGRRWLFGGRCFGCAQSYLRSAGLPWTCTVFVVVAVPMLPLRGWDGGGGFAIFNPRAFRATVSTPGIVRGYMLDLAKLKVSGWSGAGPSWGI